MIPADVRIDWVSTIDVLRRRVHHNSEDFPVHITFKSFHCYLLFWDDSERVATPRPVNIMI
jgi:hypothetical protein